MSRDRRSIVRSVAVTVLAGTLVGGMLTACGSGGGDKNEVRNIIFLLGDGMGRTHITAARQRYYGAKGQLNMEKMPFLGTVATYAVEERSDRPALVTDSASAATAWGSGVKTYNAAIGVDAYGKSVPTLMEEAKKAGFATGNVSTAEVTDATPAAQYAHALLRGCQGPTYSDSSCLPKKKDGSFVDRPSDPMLITPIAQQIARNNTADVTFGGGLARFQPDDQKALLNNGYEVLGSFGDPAAERQTAETQKVATKDDLAAVKSDRVIGLFNRGNMTVETTKAALPEGAPERKEPQLVDMTNKAIELLSKKAGDKGFYLQVEGASIDKRSHANDANQTLGEMKAFDDAVAAAVEFAKKDGHTLVLVTADHECAGFNIIEKKTFTNAEAAAPPVYEDSNATNNSTPARKKEDNVLDPARSTGIVNGEGRDNPKNFAPATFRTKDDPADVQDGSPDASLWLSYLSGNHTGQDVMIYAFGPGADQYAASQENTALYTKMKKAILK